MDNKDQWGLCTVRKAKRDAGPQHKENSFTHTNREVQYLVLTDFSDRSMWMIEFSVTLVFWSCVTLGFFNSAMKKRYRYFKEMEKRNKLKIRYRYRYITIRISYR
jgi:hypothetical protein